MPAQTDDAHILRVSGTTPPKDLAAAVANACYAGTPPTLRAIGAASLNQAIKALIIANQYAASRGMSLTFRPGFDTVLLNEDEVTAITLRVLID